MTDLIVLIELLLGIFIICITLFYDHYIRTINLLKKKNAELNLLMETKSTLDTSNPPNMNGIFEIHITINPKNNYVKLLDFIQLHKFERKFKLVHAVSSSMNNQYMLSYFTHKTDDQLAVNSALETAAALEKGGITVIRTKVEAHDAVPIPLTDRDYKTMIDHLHTKYASKSHKQYFEFHCKINKEGLDLENLEKQIAGYEGTAISYNLCSANKNPLLTIRVYDAGLTSAVAYKNKVMDSLKEKGYIFEDKIQQEFAVYDSNPTIDNGWLRVSPRATV